jgi:AcrR family transcriptional regulator
MKNPSGLEFASAMNSTRSRLAPRKLPIQARSAVTVEALHAAAIQVLVRDGLQRCTTTRIAARAGTSVGSLYQYYPNRDALLRAVLERHIGAIAAAVEAACRQHRGKCVAEMAAAVVRAYLAAKLHDPAESRALYAIAEERDGASIAVRGRDRMAAALAEMLGSAADAQFDDLETIAAVASAVLTGAVLIALRGPAADGLIERLGTELVTLLTAYLRASARPDPKGATIPETRPRRGRPSRRRP